MENNHTAEIGWIMLKAELLKDCVDDIAAGIVVKGIDPKTLTESPVNRYMSGQETKKKLDGLSALRFLRGESGRTFCASVGIDPSSVMAQGRKIGLMGQKPQGRPRITNGETVRYIDISGQRFGRLMVICPDGSGHKGIKRWLCRCDCGKECSKPSNCLRRGKTVSCGCRMTLPKKRDAA